MWKTAWTDHKTKTNAVIETYPPKEVDINSPRHITRTYRLLFLTLASFTLYCTLYSVAKFRNIKLTCCKFSQSPVDRYFISAAFYFLFLFFFQTNMSNVYVWVLYVAFYCMKQCEILNSNLKTINYIAGSKQQALFKINTAMEFAN